MSGTLTMLIGQTVPDDLRSAIERIGAAYDSIAAEYRACSRDEMAFRRAAIRSPLDNLARFPTCFTLFDKRVTFSPDIPSGWFEVLGDVGQRIALLPFALAAP